MKIVLGIIGAGVLAFALYLFLTVWSVGWIKHDGTITVTCPENQKVYCNGN